MLVVIIRILASYWPGWNSFVAARQLAVADLSALLLFLTAPAANWQRASGVKFNPYFLCAHHAKNPFDAPITASDE